MKTNITQIFLIIFGVLVAGIIFFQGNGLVVGDEEDQRDTHLELGLWTSGTTIEQTFIASRNNLSRIDFAVDSYRPWDSPYLDFRLFKINTAENPRNLTYNEIVDNLEEVRYKRLNGWLISIHMFNSFSFAPIADSLNTHYLISISSPGLRQGGTSILLASPRERYDYGDLFVDGEKKDGDLAFRALYQQPRTRVFQQTVARLTPHKPFPFSIPGAYYVLFLVYAALLAGFLGLILKRKS